MRLAICFALIAAPAAPAAAQDYRVLLGGAEIGAVSVSRAGEELSLRSRFADTPLGVADGTFDADSRPVQGEGGAPVRQYFAASDFTTEQRQVSVLHDGGRVLAVDIAPESERSDLSDPAAVPAGVIDPVQAMDAIVGAGGCPPPFRFYDGRRVVEVAVAAQEGEGAAACAGTYTVVAGPAHLRPLGIRTVRLFLAYGADGLLSELTLAAGPFEMSLVR